MSGMLTEPKEAEHALDAELVIDNFAGGGGASHGITQALGRSPDYAINHDEKALEMHRANHPLTEHLVEDVWNVDPLSLVAGRSVALAWFSPDCKHFSRAKGGKPCEKRIRSLAWVAVKWAKQVRPRIIMLENVPEFQTWGPLLPNNLPNPDKKGLTFKRFIGYLRGQGYKVEWKTLDAASYGAPTHRKRLFLIARCDGQPIVWPEQTHGTDKTRSLFRKPLKPYKTAAECIDWSIPCPSIFTRKRPLADNTMRRVANGLKRYVLDASEPFIIQIQHYGREHHGNDLKKPMNTITAYPKGGAHGLVVPYLVPRYGEAPNQEPRSRDINKPMPTIVQTANGGTLVAAFLAKHFGGATGCKLDQPSPTATTRGTQTQLTTAFMVHMNHGDKQWSDCRKPMRTIRAGGTNHAEVRAFLVKYYGTSNAADIGKPAPTITTKDRLGLVTVAGDEYQIVDIGMRMLSPRELARAQGFPDDYVLTGTKTNQVAKIGNSVCPPVVKALVSANLGVSHAG